MSSITEIWNAQHWATLVGCCLFVLSSGFLFYGQFSSDKKDKNELLNSISELARGGDSFCFISASAWHRGGWFFIRNGSFKYPASNIRVQIIDVELLEKLEAAGEDVNAHFNEVYKFYYPTHDLPPEGLLNLLQ